MLEMAEHTSTAFKVEGMMCQGSCGTAVRNVRDLS
jgi:hypothetical protein